MLTNRYQGLLFLRDKGLPVPSIIKVDSIYDLSLIPIEDGEYGWTIRTCKRNGIDEFGLYFKNQLSYKELILELKLRENFFSDEFYVVYKSWQFYFSCNLLRTRYEIIIEGKYGSQKMISSGKEQPGFYLKYNLLNSSISESNVLDEYVTRRILIAISLLRKAGITHYFYSELAVTSKNEFYFYEYWIL